MKDVIEGCRSSFKSLAPQMSAWERWTYLRMTPPKWLKSRPNDEVWEVYRRQQVLLTAGAVVWGCLVQANEILFEPGPINAGGMLIYSQDTYFDDHVDDLADLAGRLFKLKGSVSTGVPALDDFARIITCETKRVMRYPIPTMMTEGREAFATSFMVQRTHLPHGYLEGGVFPILVCPRQTKAAMILPSRFWPPTLHYAWPG